MTDCSCGGQHTKPADHHEKCPVFMEWKLETDFPECWHGLPDYTCPVCTKARIDKLEAENKAQRETAQVVVDVLLPAETVHIGSKHYKYSACYRATKPNPIINLAALLQEKE